MTKFHFNSTLDSKEISKSVTSIMQKCLWWSHKFWNLWISQKHKNLDISRTKKNFFFFSNKKKSLITYQGLLYAKNTFVVEVTFKSVKRTSMPNPVKCYSSSSPRPVKSPSNFVRYNCQKIWSSSRRPKTVLEIRKNATFLSRDQQSYHVFQRLH